MLTSGEQWFFLFPQWGFQQLQQVSSSWQNWHHIALAHPEADPAKRGCSWILVVLLSAKWVSWRQAMFIFSLASSLSITAILHALWTSWWSLVSPRCMVQMFELASEEQGSSWFFFHFISCLVWNSSLLVEVNAKSHASCGAGRLWWDRTLLGWELPSSRRVVVIQWGVMICPPIRLGPWYSLFLSIW